MVKEVRSPHSLTRDQPHAQRGISPGSRSSPSNARSDSHLAHTVGKGGHSPASLRRDSTPVVGESGDVAINLEQALAQSMREIGGDETARYPPRVIAITSVG